MVDPAKAANGLEDPLAEPVGAYSTISAALAAAPAGATVVVRPGTYNERVFIRRPVKLLADRRPDGTGAVLDWKGDKPYECALDVDVSGAAEGSVFVSGLTIRHYSYSIAQNYGVFVHSPAERKIKFRACDIASSSGSGIGVESGDVYIKACTVHDCKNHGVLYVGSAATGRVEGCKVEKCKLNGLLLRDGASPTLSKNLLTGNGQYGAALIDCRGVFEDSNEMKGNAKGAVSGECDDYVD